MGDLKALMQVPGIGKKGAERLVLELRDRLGAPPSTPRSTGPPPAGLARSPPVAPWRDQLTAGAGRPRLDRQGGRRGGRRSSRRSPTSRSPPRRRRGRRAAAPGAAAAGPGVTPPFDRALTAADAGRGAGRRLPVVRAAGDEERVVESALRPHSLADFIGQPKVARAARPRAARAPSAAAGRRTTCCCPARPGWARPAWR